MQHDLVALDIDHMIVIRTKLLVITFESFNLTLREVDLYGKNAPFLQLPCKYNRHDLVACNTLFRLGSKKIVLTGREIYKQFRINFLSLMSAFSR